MSTRHETDIVIIGASAAGLAVAACLKQAGLSEFTILEKTNCIGAAWRNHYDRLHLHTAKRHSALPGLPLPKQFPKYPARDQVVAYLENYAAQFSLQPAFGQEVRAVEPQNGRWQIQTHDRHYLAQKVVFATGYNRVPNKPSWPGMDRFGGAILHSADYKNGRPFAGQNVLVVGFGNSGGEIAIDLHEHGAKPSIAVRSAVNVIPRDLFGIPILSVGIVLGKFSSGTSDKLSAPLLRLVIGDLTRYGLRKLPYGPVTQIRRHGRIPLLDVGTVALIKKGAITVRPGVQRFLAGGVEFEDGKQAQFDAVVCATGYRPDLRPFLHNADGALDASGNPVCSGSEAPVAGLYFCGYYVSPNGMLREIGLEAERISQDLRAKLK